MKFVWEARDFHSEGHNPSEFYPYGAILGKVGTTNQYLLGYTGGSGHNACLIAMSDGNVFAQQKSRGDMVDYLNENGFYPLVQRKQ